MSVVAVSNGIGEGVSVRIGCVEVEYEGLVFGNGKVSVRWKAGVIGPAFDEVGYEDLSAEGDRSVAVGNPDGSLVTVVELPSVGDSKSGGELNASNPEAGTISKR